MKILAWPARRNREQNPFNFLLSEALASQGAEVVELDRRNSLFGRFDVFHIHWPQQEAGGPLPRALGRSALLALRLIVQRLRGARIVWTVHNVNAHDQTNPHVERMLMRIVVALLDGAIFLTASSREAAFAAMPALRSCASAIIPHGVYGQRSTKDRAVARAAFGLPPTGGVVGFLGDIRPYKGLDLLLDAFEQIPPGQMTLFVAGSFPDKAYGVVVSERFVGLSAKGRAIVFRDERLSDKRLVDAIRASDVVALPYRAIWNSGLAILVIENAGRIVASDAPVFRELREEVGPEWVRVAGAQLTAADLIAALSDPRSAASPRLAAFCAARSWQNVASETLAFYQTLGVRVPSSSHSPATNRHDREEAV